MTSSLFAHPILGALLRYWQGKQGARAMPLRRDIDPLEMGPNLLPHLVLADLFDRGTRVRFRLVGTDVVRRLGFDPTSSYLEAEAKGGWADMLASLHRLVYAERAPVQAESEFLWGNGRRRAAQLLLLPLTQDGPDPAIALAGFVFSSAEIFPPPIRALDECATHVELRRAVLKTLPSIDTARRVGREVA
jgi:hypothetical protein